MVTGMAEPDVGADRRLFGMMQQLMLLAANQELPESAPARHVVTRDDAVTAVLLLAAVLDDAIQDGSIPTERGVAVAAMLMLIRDYIEPLPAVLADDGVSDKVTPDLAKLVTVLRQQGGATGIQG
jgi:hypothetical protein